MFGVKQDCIWQPFHVLPVVPVIEVVLAIYVINVLNSSSGLLQDNNPISYSTDMPNSN